MADLFELNERFGIQDQLTFKAGPGDLAHAEIANRHAVATVSLQGAHLLGWMPRGEQPVIWLSPHASFAAGQAIRGGVPVCWPWFGTNATHPAYPAHGFARTLPWQLHATTELEDGATLIVFRLTRTEATAAYWPYPSELELGIKVGAGLELDLITRNTGVETITVGEALHTYFAVSDVRQIVVEGLEGCSYIDKTGGDRRKQQSGAVTVSEETDRIYLDATADCLINDPGMGRRIRIGKRGSRTTVVWNPWIDKSRRMGDMGEHGYLHMLCVESANAADNLVTVAPGGMHQLYTSYQLESL